ncbi:hypothetical protein LTR37_006850 [Vermiconidia calcicola]|uniref:Uncharacterized protein n=1 Tax=Vermiconidia calcicola TaxID=1690605 RepID=A0ACC3NGK1_9PEZI|nr:hypothetical protein LTR37_006850 [Vermiconidia calcicola]
MHKSSDCPQDPEIAKLIEQAKDEGWQRCYSCNAMVEKKEGCNHMTCRYRLNEMRVPEPIQVMYRQVYRVAADPVPPPPPNPAATGRNGRPGPPPEVTYQQEIDQRRLQERLDADLARRLQLASLMEPENEPRVRRRGDDNFGLGNAARHFMNDDFVQNAANVVMSAFGDANLGRRGERSSGRRRRARQADQNENEPGLAPNFLGDESILGARPAGRSRRAS